jgi:hypothetical protein
MKAMMKKNKNKKESTKIFLAIVNLYKITEIFKYNCNQPIVDVIYVWHSKNSSLPFFLKSVT